jgi:hypothetical protein
VTVRDTTPPLLTLPANITVNATGPTGAVVTYSASATDLVDGARAVTCSPASGATFAIGTTTVSCSAQDTRGNRANGTFRVTVQGAAAQITDAIGLVNSFALAQGLSNNLVSKLQAALDLVNAGKSGACGKLVDFVSTVNAQTGKGITPQQASQLIASATRIKAVLGCP